MFEYNYLNKILGRRPSLTETASSTPRLPRFAKAAMAFQAFLLRRNWLGSMGDEIMVITTTGRKTGRLYTTPVGYLCYESTVVALNPGGGSNWYKNVLKNKQARLEIKGKTYQAQAAPIEDPEERKRIFECYRHERTKRFKFLFGVKADASPEKLDQALASRRFIRFYLA
jgi:deazaflavin-dependent oxidoreductase (nitroreductase family)